MSYRSGDPEPTTLKYRSEVCRSGATLATSRMSHSLTSLVSPYGDSGQPVVVSVTTSTSGVP